MNINNLYGHFRVLGEKVRFHMKIYVFLDEDGNTIERVIAEDHSEAVDKANGWKTDGVLVTSDTDFYTEEVEL